MNDKRARWSWAFYDWANSSFATTVMAGFFPLFFAAYWARDLAQGERTFWLGVASSLASVVVMLMAPLLGGIADRHGYKKRFLFLSTLLGALSTAAMFAVAQGNWPLALTLFTLGSIGFFAGTSFYDSLIVSVAPPEQLDRLSALGYGLGYLGGGLLFALNVFMYQKPQFFGLASGAEAILWSFLMVGVWWLLFSLPLFACVRERPAPHENGRSDWQALMHTFRQILGMRPVLLFLCAYWLYIDAVDTIIRMAVDYGVKLGFAPGSLILALLMVQFIGFPAAVLFGVLAERVGTKTMIYVALLVYAGVTCGSYFLLSETQFFLMAAAIGLVQGGIQSLSRSYYARLIPADQAGQFFGFYNMLGKFAAVLGPFVVGQTALLVDNQRLPILSLLPFFIIGGLLLTRVRAPLIR
ncbi:MFS transporter, UMF1 family [Solimonas aquatica]|uniref:MFS transporter, UMF1 family n=1 Tax=Solimonas aquatica TaxID=489703 RepID=A0A1H8ZF40_9GAMM|nr:MFS transporter [Solimonas aquatica]SEP62955.1 MFS transporter, UMF1 family [Solimonas aquatica]